MIVEDKGVHIFLDELNQMKLFLKYLSKIWVFIDIGIYRHIKISEYVLTGLNAIEKRSNLHAIYLQTITKNSTFSFFSSCNPNYH